MTFFFHYLTRNNRFSKRRKSLKSAAAQNSSSSGRDDEQQQLAAYHYSTIIDLPSHILIDILSRLPLKSIFISRCVCKTWHILISDPLFATLHFDRNSGSNPELYLRTDFSTCISRTLHWVDLESFPGYNHAQCQWAKINAQFYLPKRYPKPNPKACTSNGNSNRGNRRAGREYDIVNSCNGFLCLRKPFHRNPCIICNPITGEYVTIPKPAAEDDKKTLRTVISGFGYSFRSKQYKVLRLVFDDFLNRTAEIYALGGAAWRKVGNAPWSPIAGLFPTYLNGVIHWVCDDIEDDQSCSDCIVGFDFEDERFCVIPAPPHFAEKPKTRDNLYDMNLGVLGGCLSICDVTYFAPPDIWVMKDYGVQESWIKQLSVDNGYFGICRPIKYLDDGSLLLFCKRRALVLYNPVEKNTRYLLIHEDQSMIFEAITHVPSFLSLKDVGGDNLTVQNINSRSDQFEPEESETLFLIEMRKAGELLY